MTISIEGLRNYSATVIRVPKVRKAENSDRLYIVDALGMTAIVDDSWIAREGQYAVLFPAEVQLSEDFTAYNNLYREADMNVDPRESGYIERNRRVRALKLRGNISNALVLPLESVVRIIPDGMYKVALREGDVFDTYAGIEFCRKYVVPTKETHTKAQGQVKKAFRRVDNTFLPEHFETGQWLREEHSIDNSETVIVTQKLHGTSCRLANTIVNRQLKWYERALQKMGVDVKTHDYDLVAGSKRVIKDPNNPNQQHFYKQDVWTDALRNWGHLIPKNFVVYGELVGYTEEGAEIQKGHTYECDPNPFFGEYVELYVYRVAIITEEAELVDLSWDQVRAFCARQGLKHVPELLRTKKGLLYIDAFDEINFWEKYQQDLRDGNEHVAYTDTPVKLSDGGTGKDEGIAIRVERGMNPLLFKYKNKSHYLWETNELDTGEADIESSN